MIENNIKIVLNNGIIIPCKSFGYLSNEEIYGTFIFNTSIIGYEEALTDPSYSSEILVMSFPQQGIYGISEKDMESKKIHVSAYVVTNYELNWSNNHAKKSLDEFLKIQKVLGVYDVDTRFLTKIIRTEGSLKGAIVSIDADIKIVLDKINKWECNNQVMKVSPSKIQILNNTSKKTIVFYDFGSKNSIKAEFIKRGYRIVVVPYNTTANDALAYKPEFVFLSNGPGDPTSLVLVIKEIKKLLAKKIKIVGICLGHQLLALALNLEITRLKFGHHSINHPVKNFENNKVYITSQNHNYTVVKNNLNKNIEVFLTSLNDQSIEGMKSINYNFISTQFHPEASPGTSDANEFFDLFIEFNNKGDKK